MEVLKALPSTLLFLVFPLFAFEWLIAHVLNLKITSLVALLDV